MTHKDLVKYGRKWLSSRSPIVVSELASGAGEQPDVIAFQTSYKIGSEIVLLECKATRQDFKSDEKKYYRQNPDNGMGDHRYYLTPKNLITVDELPDRWGLLECSPSGRIKIIKKSKRMECNERGHTLLLISLLRRLEIDAGDHVSLRVYTTRTKNRASLTLSEGETQ